MTVSTTTLKQTYGCDSATTSFPVPFPFIKNSHVYVIRHTISSGANLLLNESAGDYTLTGAGSGSGTVTTATAYSNLYEIIIVRELPILQGMDLTAHGTIPAESLESAFDYLTMVDQQLDSRIAVLETAGATGTTTLANVGAGTGTIFRDQVSSTYNLKTIKAGSNIAIANNADDITISSTAGGITFPGSTNQFLRGDGNYSNTLTGGLLALAASAAAAITNTGHAAFSGFNNGTITPSAIYSAILNTTANHFDSEYVTLHVPTGSTTDHMSALGIYVRNDVAVSGINRNAVGAFVAGLATVDNGATWGINTLLMDAATRTTHAGVGRILTGAELDFNVMGTNTQVIGVSVGGNSLAQPGAANAFIANSLGTGIYWTGAFVTFDGTAQYGLSLGTQPNPVAGTASQIVSLNARNASNAAVNLQMVNYLGALYITGNAGTGLTGIHLGTQGSRILADFSDGGLVTRGFFQTNVLNGATTVGVLPNGTSQTTSLQVLSLAGALNSSYADLQMVGGTKARIRSNAFGAGTALPFTIEPNSLVAATFDINGDVRMAGGDTADLATGATARFLYIPTCAGTPTGAPTARTGYVPIVYDRTNNKIAVYNGGVWKQTAALT